jgi:hypothetical protein
MNDSIVGDQWITQTMASCPPQLVFNQDTGQPTGDIITGPVRLAFDALFKPNKDDNDEDKYGAALLFPPNVNLQLFYDAFYQTCGEEFSAMWDGQQYQGVKSPFKDQSEKTRFGGFTPGCVYINAGSRYQPPVTDIRYNPIVDESKVYPGVWAICAVNTYAYKTKTNKGISFGLQNVMIIGDDKKFGGGAKANKDQFAGVNVSAPISRPDMSGMGNNNVPQQPQGLPGYSAPAGAPAPAGFTPPGTAPTATPPSSTQPGQHSAAPATTSPSDFDFMN